MLCVEGIEEEKGTDEVKKWVGKIGTEGEWVDVMTRLARYNESQTCIASEPLMLREKRRIKLQG